jgi:hypothetical protein
VDEFTDEAVPPKSIRFWVCSPYAGTQQEVIYSPPGEWSTMTPDERTAWCQEVLDVEVDNYLDSGYAASDDEPED